jgi:hypothetical protein
MKLNASRKLPNVYVFANASSWHVQPGKAVNASVISSGASGWDLMPHFPAQERFRQPPRAFLTPAGFAAPGLGGLSKPLAPP